MGRSLLTTCGVWDVVTSGSPNTGWSMRGRWLNRISVAPAGPSLFSASILRDIKERCGFREQGTEGVRHSEAWGYEGEWQTAASDTWK